MLIIREIHSFYLTNSHLFQSPPAVAGGASFAASSFSSSSGFEGAAGLAGGAGFASGAEFASGAGFGAGGAALDAGVGGGYSSSSYESSGYSSGGFGGAAAGGAGDAFAAADTNQDGVLDRSEFGNFVGKYISLIESYSPWQTDH